MSNLITERADIFWGGKNEITGLDGTKEQNRNTYTHTHTEIVHNNKFKNNVIRDSIRVCLGQLIGFGYEMIN